MIFKFTAMNLITNTLLSIQLMGDYFLCMGQIILLQNIHRKSTCSSVSAKTQILYTIIFSIRYMDLLISYSSLYESFKSQPLLTLYILINNSVKIAHIFVLFWTLLVIFALFRESECRKHDVFRYEILVAVCAIFTVVLNDKLEAGNTMWMFSIYLEAVATIPQRYIISKTKQVDGIVFCYFGLLSLYKLCYMTNWIYSSIYLNNRFENIAFAAGIVQLIFYCDIFISRRLSKSRISIQENDFNKTVAIPNGDDELRKSSSENKNVTFKNKHKITFQVV